MLCKTFCNVNKSLDITRSDKQDGCLIFEKSYHRNKTSNENHWKDHCGQALVGIYWGTNCIGNEKRGSFYVRKFGTVLSFANHVFPNREPKPGLGQFGLVSIMKFPKCE